MTLAYRLISHYCEGLFAKNLTLGGKKKSDRMSEKNIIEYRNLSLSSALGS